MRIHPIALSKIIGLMLCVGVIIVLSILGLKLYLAIPAGLIVLWYGMIFTARILGNIGYGVKNELYDQMRSDIEAEVAKLQNKG